MGRDAQQPEADVIVGAIKWQGTDAGPHTAEPAEVIRLAPYLVAQRRPVAPPANGV